MNCYTIGEEWKIQWIIADCWGSVSLITGTHTKPGVLPSRSSCGHNFLWSFQLQLCIKPTVIEWEIIYILKAISVMRGKSPSSEHNLSIYTDKHTNKLEQPFGFYRQFGNEELYFVIYINKYYTSISFFLFFYKFTQKNRKRAITPLKIFFSNN